MPAWSNNPPSVPNATVPNSAEPQISANRRAASLSGGVASIFGVIVGVLITGAAQNALNLLDVPTFYQYVVRGGILLLAVIVDQLRQRARRPAAAKA